MLVLSLGRSSGQLGVQHTQAAALDLQALFYFAQSRLELGVFPMLDYRALLLFEPLFLDVGPVGDRRGQGLVFLRDLMAQLLDMRRSAACIRQLRELLLGTVQLDGE